MKGKIDFFQKYVAFLPCQPDMCTSSSERVVMRRQDVHPDHMSWFLREIDIMFVISSVDKFNNLDKTAVVQNTSENGPFQI